jgi:hypothetical protein
MSSPLAKLARRPWRGVAALALLAVAPKCVVCLVGAYAGLGALLGLAGPELCGAPADPSADAPHAWATKLAWCGVILALGLFSVLAALRANRTLAAP